MPEQETLIPLKGLPRERQLAFALLVFERMLPGLTAFSKATGFDDCCYLEARGAAWATLQGNAASRASTQALNQACLQNAPDTDKFSHESTSYALNAALAMSDILEFMLDGRADHIAHVSTLAQDSVDLYLSSLGAPIASSPEENRKIASHPLMRQEQRREDEDINFLSDLPGELDERAISALKARASEQAPLLPQSR
ncbi:MAG: DUF416 family protein [Acidobacteriota bacterium]|nr:DUF416 family protein [Acidobacteriota bacterium]